jgi:hypothetical protein
MWILEIAQTFYESKVAVTVFAVGMALERYEEVAGAMISLSCISMQRSGSMNAKVSSQRNHPV